ncbi:MAG: DUF445 family protein [Clostridia bacterium]|nr:DUF445 family protein [Clostridia bacterium]
MIIARAIVAPLLGGVIGYITNDLAIRMLFRPRKAVYIGRFHVPFTPGLIPAQQGRIAQSIGDVVSSQLLNEETLRQTLLSEATVQKLQDKVSAFLRKLSKDGRRVRELLAKEEVRERVNLDVDALTRKLTEGLTAKIIESKLGYTVVDSIIGDKMDFINQNKWLSMLVDDNAQKSIKEKLAEKVDEIIAEKAPDAVAAIVERYKDEIMDARICDLYARFEDKEDVIIEKLSGLYTSILGDNLGRLLKAINIEKIVVDKINGLDPAELETVIFGVMKKELRAIVYLGALLGFLMGFINLLL